MLQICMIVKDMVKVYGPKKFDSGIIYKYQFLANMRLNITSHMMHIKGLMFLIFLQHNNILAI